MAARYLSGSALERLDVPTADVVDALERAVRRADAGTVLTAPKSVLLPEDGRYVMATLAVSDDPPHTAVKTLVLNPHNAARGLPTIDGVVTLIDSHSGALCGLVDAKWVTAVRTAGLSLLAARSLARPDSRSVAFVGCGVQARSHLAALAATYPLEEVVLLGRSRQSIETVAAQARALGLRVREAADPADALAGADVVVSSLTRDPDRAPFLDARLLRPGTFATITDLAEPWLPASMGAFDRVVVDDAAQEREAAVKLVDPALVHGDLADLVTGRTRGRTGEDERTAFVFRGIGLADLAIASLALVQAETADLGHVIPLD